MAGQFISLEGPDGAGKTSVLTAVIERLQKRHRKRIVVTREPGGDHISEAVRQVILDPKNTAMDDRTEALLYAAARRQHIKTVIQPALDRDQVVLCDRFVDSSVAYQGAGRKIGEVAVYEMNMFATGGLMPEKTLYFDVPADVGLARIKAHRQTTDRLDNETLAFHQRVRAGYLRLRDKYPERIIVIDATQPMAQVIDTTLTTLNRLIRD